jgi:succinate dehydrogenase / fumarate reductase membrane anchor subunit
MMRDQKLWTWHVGAGVVILVLLGLHMTIMHLDAILKFTALNPAGGEPIDWQNVVKRGQMIFFPLTYVLLLGAALFHGLYGVRNILFELSPSSGLKRALSALLIVVGLGLFVLGTLSALASFALARSL